HNLIYRAIAYRTSSTIVTCFVLDSAPRMGIQTFRQSRCGVDKDIPGIGDVYFIILLPAFCSNEDDAIRCSGSINGRSCRILQHGNGLNVLRIQRSEEHTSELQSRENLVCRLLLEKKKEKKIK